MASSAQKPTQFCRLTSPLGTTGLGGIKPPILRAPSVRRQERGAHSSSVLQQAATPAEDGAAGPDADSLPLFPVHEVV